MATYTSHYNLTKPEGTERVNIAIINQNMDSIDAQMYKNAQSIIANHGGMAIPSNNNTHAAVSSGQYVYVYNHSSLAEGMYVAKSAISTNGALSLSNLTAVSNGGLNHVYSTLNSNLVNKATTKADVLTVPKNGTVTLPYSNFGMFTNGHVYIVTIIGDNPSWSYFGILYFSGSRTKITKLDNSYINVSVDSSQFTIANTHAEYDQRVAVEVIGRY